MKFYERGSEWRRWDLHVHTPETKKNDRYKGNTVEEKWDKFYEKIEQYVGDGSEPHKAVAVIGITDYLSIDNYLKVIADNRLPESVLLVLPNVELRIAPMAKTSPINIHCIFSPDVAKELETRFFSKLKFKFEDRTYGATHEELKQLGKAFTGDNSLDDIVAYKTGLEQYVISLDSLREVFKADPLLREKTIIVVSNSSGDGVSGIVEHVGYLTGTMSQMDATRRSIYQFADMVFSAKNSDIKYFLGKGVDNVETVKRKCGSLMACVHGSDAHDNDMLFEPNEKKYCWIKADPSFNGLRQVLYEPESRVRIGAIMPDVKPGYHVIEHIEIHNPNFAGTPIVFNDKLTCIIGGKSTGKSLLLHNIAFAIDEFQVEEKLQITNSNSKIISGVKVYWADGSVSSSIHSDSEHKIVYIPQTYLNRLSDEHEELTEIDKIIHEIVLINEEAKKAYENMLDTLASQKLEIEKLIYDLLQENKVAIAKRAELKEIGTHSGIEKEINKLKQQKKQLSQEIDLTDVQIKQYDEALSALNRVKQLMDKNEEELQIITEMSVVITPKVTKNSFSEDVQEMVNRAIGKITTMADREWVNSRAEIVSMLNERAEKLEKERAIYQEVISRLAPKISENEAVDKLSMAIQREEQKLAHFDEIEKQMKQCEKQVNEFIDTLVHKFMGFASIHQIYANSVNANSALDCDDLEFSVETPFRKEAFISLIEKNFDKRSLKAQKQLFECGDVDEAWLVKENIKNLVKACVEGKLRLTGGKTIENALREILGDWYNSAYRVIMDGDALDEMSPGKKALVLLKMIINLADSTCPILIDQPEDDLDNRSIFDELIPFIKRKKIERQIIIVTHNANVVLGGDAEEVIVANQQGKNAPNEKFRFEYRSGSIEEDRPINSVRTDILGKKGIQQHICDVLEGGEAAFDLRKNKYRI